MVNDAAGISVFWPKPFKHFAAVWKKNEISSYCRSISAKPTGIKKEMDIPRSSED